MYEDIIELAMDQQLLTELSQTKTNYKKLPVWKQLHNKTDQEIDQLKNEMAKNDELTFNVIFNEPIGYHFLHQFLDSQHSADKAIFIRDVDIFKTIKDPKTQIEVAQTIYDAFCGPEQELLPEKQRLIGSSCLRMSTVMQRPPPPPQIDSETVTDANTNTNTNTNTNSHPQNNNNNHNNNHNHTGAMEMEMEMDMRGKGKGNGNGNGNDQGGGSPAINLHSKSQSVLHEGEEGPTSRAHSSFISENSNAIGIYGKPLKNIQSRLSNGDVDVTLFDEVTKEIIQDLRLDIFPRFLRSPMFGMYLRCRAFEDGPEINVNSFYLMRMLGRGAFGSVNACKKKDTGKIYAMKQIDKRRVQATDSVKSLIAERDFLALMDSLFVTGLKYAFMDDNTLYLLMDLMTGGDLKFHLNHDKVFAEIRAKYYAAQILLGLEHIHSKGIIYRDLKLENILVDDNGKCKISDLGLAVSLDDGPVRGYAGTPGYTAPEVVLTQYYSTTVDFFSFGVVIYRCLCGRKPFARRKPMNTTRQTAEDRLRKTSIELDRNVVEMIPPFDSSRFTPNAKSLVRGLLQKNAGTRLGSTNAGAKGMHGINEDIRQHPWFDEIDFGLLEAGYLKAPFVPACDEIYAEQQQYIGHPPDDDKYSKIKITPAFDDSLKGFPFLSSPVLQREIIELLQKVFEDRCKSTEKMDSEKLYAFPMPEEVGLGKTNQCFGNCILL